MSRLDIIRNDPRVPVLRRHGIRYPAITIEQAREARLGLALACTLLEKESAGGHNVWGHDRVRTGQQRGGRVTRANYLVYKWKRQMGYGAQGCGPTQLTYPGYQDEADRQGGCWKVSANMLTGFRILTANIRRNGIRRGAQAYNGSGRAAVLYGLDFMVKHARWKRRLRGL